MYTIGKVARQMGVSADTLRYYEKEGLIAPTSKTAAGYRLYNDNALRRIRFIKHAQQCGFTLSNINDLLKLKHENSACCNDVRSVAIEKKLYLEHKIKALQQMSQALSELITICDDESRPLVECPILAALESSLDSRSKGVSHD
ncbi:MAG: heavy metal-responsive transcriptional regulator [Pseudomonadota bacterium]